MIKSLAAATEARVKWEQILALSSNSLLVSKGQEDILNVLKFPTSNSASARERYQNFRNIILHAIKHPQ